MDEDNIMDVDYTFNERLGPCEVCGVKESIYTCPKCEVKTCCLKCVRIHKKELECDGVRDKTKFIKINKFTNLDLLSDYRLLEQATRTVERCKQNKFKYNSHNQNEHLPLHLYRLNAACLRRNMILKFLPKEFTRRKTNTTYLDWKTQVIYWKVEWIFTLNENNVQIKFIDDKCSENDKFGLILQKYFENINDDYNKLEFYQSAGLNNIKLLLKAEEKRGGKQYYELDVLSTFKDAFKYKLIIENPTIHVVFNEHLPLYNIIDVDEERANLLKESSAPETENGEDVDKNNIMSNILNVKNVMKRRKKHKKNLLITNTDGTDDEDEEDDDEDTSSSLDIKIPKRMTLL